MIPRFFSSHLVGVFVSFRYFFGLESISVSLRIFSQAWKAFPCVLDFGFLRLDGVSVSLRFFLKPGRCFRESQMFFLDWKVFP